MDLPFRLTFLALFVSMAAVRLYWHRRAEITRPGVANPSEGAWVTPARWLVLPVWMGILLAWLWDPSLLPWVLLPLPDAARWAGVPIFGLGLALLVWVHVTLGRNFSPFLRIRADHRLITAGPYRRVRHPMYTAFLLLMAGLALVSAHALLALTGFGMLIAILTLRTPREEAMLTEAFGDEYRAYVGRTGRLLPRP